MSKKKSRHDHGLVVGNIREIVFGLEDGLVSTLGAVTGIAAGANSTAIVILSGIVLVVVEALSMAAGSYLSSKSVVETEKALAHGKDIALEYPIMGGLVMFVAYIFGGSVPLLPYFFTNISSAYYPSIGGTVFCLFLVGVWSAKYTKRSKVKSGLEMAGISLAAAIVGYLIGRIVSHYFMIDIPV